MRGARHSAVGQSSELLDISGSPALHIMTEIAMGVSCRFVSRWWR